MRDVVREQTGWNKNLSWLCASLPCLCLALFGLSGFVGFARFASVIQVVTGIAIIIAYGRSRRKAGTSSLCGILGALPFRIAVIFCSLLASVGAVLTVG